MKVDHLTKKITLFFIAQLFARLSAFIIIPVQLKHLGLASFGVLELVIITCSILMPALTLNSHEGVFKYNVKKNRINLVFLPNLILILFLPIVFFLAYWKVSDLFVSSYVYLFSLCLFESFKRLLKSKNKLKLLTISEFVYSFNAVVSILILSHIDSISIRTILLCYSLSNLGGVLVVMSAFRKQLHIKEIVKLKSAYKVVLSFSSPLLPNTIVWWLIGYSDRLIITAYLGLESLGVYALILKTVSIYKILSSTVYDAVKVSLFQEKCFFKKFKFYRGRFLTFNSLILIFSIFFFPVLMGYFGVELSTDIFLLGIVLLFSAFLASLCSLYGTIYIYTSKTKDAFKSTIYSAILNIVLGLLLVNNYELIGVALSSFVSVTLLFAIRHTYSQKYFNNTDKYT